MSKKSLAMDETLQIILSHEGVNPFRAIPEFIARGALEHGMSEHPGAAPYKRTGERTG